MAPNNRRNPASLYELLDKNALKSSRKAGPLKIPDWFNKSSRTAPAAPGPPTTEPPAAAPAPASTGESAQPTTAPPIEKTPAAPSATAVSPGATVSPSPSSSDPFDRLVNAGPPSLRMVSPLSRSEAPSALGGRPPWMLLGAASLLGVILLIVVIALSRGGKSPKGEAVPTVTGPVGPTTSKLVPYPEAAVPNTDAGQPAPVDNTPVSPTMPSTAAVVAMDRVKFDPQAWYLVILTTRPALAQRAAAFIAAHGVSVTVAPHIHDLATVIAVQGYRDRANPQAIAFRRRVVHIGDLLPEARRLHRSVWSDAYFRHISIHR